MWLLLLLLAESATYMSKGLAPKHGPQLLGPWPASDACVTGILVGAKPTGLFNVNKNALPALAIGRLADDLHPRVSGLTWDAIGLARAIGARRLRGPGGRWSDALLLELAGLSTSTTFLRIAPQG